jgi:[ribosomal protein S5]-alanine N-acetyltransferase
MDVLTTNRLSLRTWAEDDLASGFAIWGDAEVMKFVDTGRPSTLEEVRSSILAGIRHQRNYGHQHWAVIENASGQLIGACGFNRTECEGELELVFHFAKASWGKGFASEAALGCIGYAKQVLKASKVVAGCHPDNEASRRVLSKLGFSFVGNRWFEDTQREEPLFELAI